MKPPPNQMAVQQQNGIGMWYVNDNWKEYFSDVFTAVFALQKSGTTAQRPTKGLYAGLPYFDSTLGQPIWYNGNIWILATGVAA